MSRVLEALGSTMRAIIAAPPGRCLVVSDLSSIEVWVVGWLTGCRKINEMAANGRDPYKSFAEMWLGLPYDEVDKPTRNLAKPPMLGSCYRLGAGKQTGPEEFTGLMAYSRSMGVELTQEQADHATQTYRQIFPEVPAFWRKWEEVAFRAILYNEGGPVGPLWIQREGEFLTVLLPSGRKLYYHKPEIQRVKAPWKNNDGTQAYVDNVTYMGKNQYTNQWTRISTHGGKGLEQASQAVARDVLAHGMLMFEEFGEMRLWWEAEIIGHIHDEAIVEANTKNPERVLDVLDHCLRTTPAWAPGLILGSEGYIAERYRKG